MQELPADEVYRLLISDEVEVIDVREDYERAAGYIEGSRHVELGALAQAAPSIERDRMLVFVCRVGGRSAYATEAFRAAGYDAYNLSGGIVEWVRRGLPLVPEGAYVAEHG